MSIQDMTDAEVYELALDILFDKLGSAGLIQFLRHCKPCTGDYTAERQKWINDDTTDVKTIVKRVRERQELIAAENVSPKSVDDMSDIEIYEFGLKAISLKLGPLGIVRFVHFVLLTTDDRMLRLAKRHSAQLHVRVENPYTWLQTIT